MWCTRWFIPLLLLPLPSAPPYFLVLFLVSLTLHAHPCFYCILLLTALFLSSCYWQPVPVDAPLSNAWITATNASINTFADALAMVGVDMSVDTRPAVVRLADRCWCELATSRLFEPFDIARWEHASVEAIKESMDRDARVVSNATASVDSESDNSSDTVEEVLVKEEEERVVEKKGFGLFSMIPSLSQLHLRSEKTVPTPPTPPMPDRPEVVVETVPVTVPVTPPPTPPSESLNLLRRQYDLRPYGFAMVIDFGWSRTDPN
ncbi:hypothetical protein BV25DRAFT_1824800 [Artomyces pyxidatus]|uniref:Uncharacterized protein n=1 Tax=Artomyces pyxidatus TaxID=48021 RepID=A0ACB8T3G6_9AGAM|nr:hypothetical protein BV25DRAFT_1824800 [Artomyces pyxidatus]